MATKIFAVILTLGLALGAFACRDDVCARKSDCGSGLTCSHAGLCVAAPDGGATDESPDVDAGIEVDAAPDGGL